MASGRSIPIRRRGACAGWLFLLAAGCYPTAQTARTVFTSPVIIPRLERNAPRTEPPTLHFDEGAASPTGCFAVSRRTGAIACVVGQYAAASDEGERRVTLLASERGEADLPLHVENAGGSTPPPIARASRIALDELMRSGDFVALARPAMLDVESIADYGNLRVEFRARPYEPAGVARENLQVLVRSRAISVPESDPTRDLLLENELADVTCTAPRLGIRTLGRSRLLIERLCELADGNVVAGAWLCDDDRDRCE